MNSRPLLAQSILPTLALGCLLAFTACQTTNSGRRGYQAGQTEYLGAPPARPNYPAAPQRPVDTVSYWDGYGVHGSPSITIDLSDQKAYFHKSGKLVGVSAISSGTQKHRTPTGSFKISQKSADHASNLYGDFVDQYDNYMVRDVSVKDTPPPGGRFKGSPMPHFMRFNGAIGMHAGYLPGYPASHGCIRMPKRMAKIFFDNVSHGTPVLVRQ